jgi:hypothetical protein
VTLLYVDGSKFIRLDGKFGTMRHEEFPTTEAAIDRACTLIDRSKGHSFAIREGTTNSSGEFLWNDPELRAENERRIKAGERSRRRA